MHVTVSQEFSKLASKTLLKPVPNKIENFPKNKAIKVMIKSKIRNQFFDICHLPILNADELPCK